MWSTKEPLIHSGTVLPVYIRSNIDNVYVVGVPKNLLKDEKIPEKIEVPLQQFHFVGSKRKAASWTAKFSTYALLYAQNIQDGLPIREFPENNSRRVYRLRFGEIIKILDTEEGPSPISAAGDPLPGVWYKVLTNDGMTGYCFSYRLNIFDNYDGAAMVDDGKNAANNTVDPDLEMILSKKWTPEIYLNMINQSQINIDEFEKKYHFDPGLDTGIARIKLPDNEREFNYVGIYPDGERAYRFESSSLEMNLRSNTTLAVRYIETSGLKQTLIFTALSSDVDDLIIQEKSRREKLYKDIYDQGPIFTSISYGTIKFSEAGGFLWSDFDLLVPHVIPFDIKGEGNVYMDLFIVPSFSDRYTGALTFKFSDKSDFKICFMYSIDNEGLRLEVVPDYGIEDITVTRRSTSPSVLYFFRDS